MTIDNAISAIEMTQTQLEITKSIRSASLDVAIETMRKYQKIQDVMDSRPDDDAKSNSKALGEIEVIMYGNDD